ncbi:putative MFS transporter [Polyplosphaeria fusca]|uniref:MFS transporter n=1 Tax=Polyplosphaeria fusca TaxID=682080 RepID=A0A9P4R0Y2_9PLEO|nr:putative MFS transporter [Polyplosphaeria fusca]
MSGRTENTPSTTKDEAPKVDDQYVHGLPMSILFIAQCLVAVLIALYMTVIATAVPSITAHFGTIEDVDWYSAAYLLSICSLQPLTAHLYNLFFLKYTFITFLSLFALGNLVGALAPTSAAFIVGRAVAGMGAAGMFNGSMVIMVASFEPSLRPRLMSLSGSMIGIGSVVGPVIGGAITEHAGWRWCLWVFLPPIGAAALVFFVQRIPEQMPKASPLSVVAQIHHKLDLVGFTLFSPASIMFLLAMSWGGSRYAWDSATIIGLLCATPVTVGLFCAWAHHRKDRALIPPSLVAKPVILWGCAVSFAQGSSWIMVAYWLPLWFQSVKGANPQAGGLMMLPTCISQILASVACSILIKRIPYAPFWSIVGNVLTAIGSALLTTFSVSTTSSERIGYQILGGVGRGFAMQMPLVAAQEILPSNQISIAAATLFFFQYFAGAAGNTIAKTIFINALGPALRRYAPNVDAESVIHAGATEVFKMIGAEDRAGVILAYNHALTLTFVSNLEKSFKSEKVVY